MGKKVPKIRFPEFTDEWEQRKVSEITKFHKQGFYTTEDYNENKKYYLLRGTDLTENKLILKDTPKIDATEKDYQAFKTEVGDFLIVRSGTVGTYGIVYEDIPAIFGSYLIDFRFDMEQVTNEFFGYFYQSESFKTQLRQIVQQSANTNINAENIKSTSIMLPSIDEQKRIGEYLGQIDNLITLHQHKCDDLKELKKGLLQKMFPSNGKNVPEIRFPGFSAPWEQRKLGELAEIKDSARIPNAEWSESGVPYIRASDITNEDASGVLFISHERYEFYKNKTGAPAKGDVLFNGGGEIGKTMLNSSDSPIYVQGGAVLYARTSASDSLDGQYLKTYFETLNAQHYFETASAGGTMKHFTLKPSQEMPIKIPKMEEQKRIGECFSELDSLITLHQRKCDDLKELKQGLLQNMFVND
ncbi:restriction endonuclease subunit S [Porcincola sp. LCP21S3_C12]|uniref:restriction endonuclease subunit S n=1 Tax=Porcincola sp. LCP21S3_C12 TaxID=3438798 RepID=UPI003F9D59BB